MVPGFLNSCVSGKNAVSPDADVCLNWVTRSPRLS